MKVKASQAVEVEISDYEQQQIALNYLSKRFSLSKEHSYYHFIRNGHLILSTEQHGGQHCWNEEEVVRRATPLDEAVLTVLHELCV